MELFNFIVLLGFIIMASTVVWVSEQKQWTTLIAIFGIFATAVTGAYIFTAKTPLTFISSSATPTSLIVTGK